MGKRKMAMKMHEFSVIASGLDPQADDFESRFFNSGCDDATVSFQKGHIILDFAREAKSIEEAISSAVECVVKAGANVDRIEPDPLVSLADIAARVHMTRAAMTQYAKGQRRNGDFPAPVVRVTSDSPLWEWSSVARWFFKEEKLDRSIAVEAEVVRAANEAIEKGGPFRACLQRCIIAF
jgi:hypothetical protein